MGIRLIKLFFSALLGLVTGLIFKQQDTLRVFVLICVGSALVTIVSTEFFKMIELPWYSDPGRLSAQILATLGFLGAGFIWISDDKEVKGLSRSAALWYTAVLGMLIGADLSSITLTVVIFAVIVYIGGTLILTRRKEKE